jgi:hypothetical protein
VDEERGINTLIQPIHTQQKNNNYETGYFFRSNHCFHTTMLLVFQADGKIP